MPTDDSSPQWSSHPTVECSQLRPRHHGTEVSCPPCTWFQFLTYRILEHKKWLFFIVEFQGGLSHSNSNWNRDPGSFCHIALQSRVLFLHVFFYKFHHHICIPAIWIEEVQKKALYFPSRALLRSSTVTSVLISMATT